MRPTPVFAFAMEWTWRQRRCGFPPGYVDQTLQPTLSGLGLACPDLVPQHVHTLVARADKLLGLHEPALARGEPERHVNKVGCASMAVEVGDEFLGRHSFELGGEVGVVHRRSSGGARQLPWELDPRPRDLELEEAMLCLQL